MRTYARSESRGGVRKLGDSESEKIGSRVLPLRGPPALMPSVGTRRSTRVFVRKNFAKVAPDGDATARVLRSGKRLTLSKPDGNKPRSDGDGDAYNWMGFLGSSGETEDTDWWKGKKEGFGSGKGGKAGHVVKCGRHATEGPKRGGDSVQDELPKCVLSEQSATDSLCDKAFRIVYNRKRRRSGSDDPASLYSRSRMKDSKGGLDSLSDRSYSSSSVLEDRYTTGRRYGIAFVRKPRSKKPRLSSLETGKPRSLKFSDKGLEMTETARCFADRVGISERYLWLGSKGHVVLVALIPSISSASSYRFTCFLVSILTGMMEKKVSLFECAAFVSSRSAASLFSLHGIHFLSLRHWKSDFSCRIAKSDAAGFCIIFGARLFLPLVSVNFSALPFLFKGWHLSIFLCSLYLPSVLARYQRHGQGSATKEGIIECSPYDSYACVENGTSKTEVVSVITPASKETDTICGIEISPDKGVRSVTGAPEPAVKNIAVICGVKLRKRRRKSSLRSGRVSSRSLLKSRRNSLLDAQRSMLKVDTGVKIHPVNEGCEFSPVLEKPVHSYLGEGGSLELAIPSPTSPNQKRRRYITKNSVLRLKEPKSAFAEVKQNIDNVSCTSNILVIESDRCWREEGAKVMLQSSSSNEWFLAVKLGDTTRFLHKAEEMKSSSSNRYTHATIWTDESGWKLEFCDKNDWNVFKELHRECCERNLQDVPVRIIPVPGVQEVDGYEENLTFFSMCPDSYIHTVEDEVDRALMSENACYDMDSGDEEWLEQLNSGSLSVDAGSPTQISKDNFEKIMSTFEKAAYSHPDDVSDQEKASSLCLDFGNRDMVAAIFDYWMKKRKQKHSALVRVFQGQPPRKRQLTQKPFLRKKRSFKKQGSNARRGKPDIFFEAAAEQDAVHKLQMAEAAACGAVNIAIQLRSRAQMLMTNADLMTYKSVMALRLAEALQESESPDLSSSILG